MNAGPVPPGAKSLDRPVGLSASQNQFVQDRIKDLQGLRATDIRVNQQQVDINGTRVGINRPDLQYTARRYGSCCLGPSGAGSGCAVGDLRFSDRD